MPFGVIVAIIVVVGFAIWGVVLLLSKVREKPAEASSHYESDIGQSGGGPPSSD